MSDPDFEDTTRKRCTEARFQRINRLTKPSEFRRVFERPTVSADECFKVLARQNGPGNARLGLAVSRQVDRTATGRNRIKRVVRESFRRWSAISETVCDIVVLPRRQSASICNRTLSQSLKRHWLLLDRRLGG